MIKLDNEENIKLIIRLIEEAIEDVPNSKPSEYYHEFEVILSITKMIKADNPSDSPYVKRIIELEDIINKNIIKLRVFW